MPGRQAPRRKMRSLLASNGGNFAITAALLLPVAFGAGGVAIDVTNMARARTHLQDAADAASLAASSGLANKTMTVDEAKLAARDFFKTQMRNWFRSSQTEEQVAGETLAQDLDVNVSEEAIPGNGTRYTVTIASTMPVKINGLTRLIGASDAMVHARSVSKGSTVTKNALSMFLVLDQSGSMGEPTDQRDPAANCADGNKAAKCYLSKMASLKLAVADLFGQLNNNDANKAYVRTGAVSYSTAMMEPSALDWGTSAAMTYTNALAPKGNTDSSGAFAAAYQALGAHSENEAHQNRTGLTPKKFIVFMTDGENNYYNKKKDTSGASDNATLNSCSQAKKDGMEVYTVAFKAPDAGKKLLSACATDSAHFFAAENAASLIAAFKTIGMNAASLSVRLTQ
ncbi:vWA domain-containing protein [Rhizobium rhizosphaerae]|nr:VWA domain-containing protein [Xaviernesmea rhizosphaerae]